MNFINKLELQPEDLNSDNINLDKLPSHKNDDIFDLKEQIDENELDNFWDEVEKDIHNDPEWFNFSE